MPTVAKIMITAAITVFIVMLIARYRKARKAKSKKSKTIQEIKPAKKSSPTASEWLLGRMTALSFLRHGIINERLKGMSFDEYHRYLKYQKAWLKKRLAGRLVTETRRRNKITAKP